MPSPMLASATEWHLRDVIRNRSHVSYVLAGSEAHLIERMMAPA